MLRLLTSFFYFGVAPIGMARSVRAEENELDIADNRQFCYLAMPPKVVKSQHCVAGFVKADFKLREGRRLFCPCPGALSKYSPVKKKPQSRYDPRLDTESNCNFYSASLANSAMLVGTS